MTRNVLSSRFTGSHWSKSWSAAPVPRGKTGAVGFKVSLSVQSETGQRQKFHFSQEKTPTVSVGSALISCPESHRGQTRQKHQSDPSGRRREGRRPRAAITGRSDTRCLGSEVRSDTRPSGAEQKKYKGGNRKSLLKCVEN